ncbi:MULTISPECIES: HAAS signaling domain-containing protein [unclassified Knoellia]|uniref:HAAS signaling domain-containing protein n=1 Tax=Knoellia altitudinis TaxID=3404795 RepID=UPI0036129DD5
MNSTVSTEVRDYVTQVRAALADLPVEDVEEFTTGMEADLAERLAEPGEGTLRDRLGEPDAYAAELRSAAGLPPRASVVGPRKPVGERLASWWSSESDKALTAMPWLRDLRPLWWAIRGFVLAAAPMWLIGGPSVFYGVVGALVSVVLGLLVRQRVLTGGWISPVRVVGNIAAVLLLPIAFVALFDRAPISNDDAYDAEAQASYGPGGGLTNSGEPVTNVYAYDQTGRRIDKVRLLDQNGRPLQVAEDFIYGTDDLDALERLRDPRTGEIMVPRDVFPLRWDARSGWEPMGDSDWTPPLAITPLPGPVPTVEPSPDTTPTATPGASVGPSPTAAPQAPPTSPSSGVSATPTPTPSSSASR